MIGISSKKNKYTYNAYHIVKSFFPGEEIIQKVEEKQEPLMAVRLPGGSCFSLAPEEVDAVLEGQKFFSEEEREQAVKKEVTRRLYLYLTEETGRTLAWGTLTGVRPTKIPMEQLEDGASEEEAARFMMKKYCVSPEKASLAAEVAARENALLSRLDCEKGSDQTAVPVSGRRDGEDACVGHADRSAAYKDSHGAAGGRRFGRRGGAFYDEEILCEPGESWSGG